MKTWNVTVVYRVTGPETDYALEVKQVIEGRIFTDAMTTVEANLYRWFAASYTNPRLRELSWDVLHLQISEV